MRCEEGAQLPARISEWKSSQRRSHNGPALELFRCRAHPGAGHGEIHFRHGLPHHARTSGAIWKDYDVFTLMKDFAVETGCKEGRILVMFRPVEQKRVRQITG